MASGYSGTPLPKKLGIKEGFKILLYNQPNNYFDLLTELPSDLTFIEKPESESVDFIHIFCTKFLELEEIIEEYKPALVKNGMLWVSWPKGKSKIKTELNRDLIRNFVLEAGLVDTKVAAIDDDWSGLKFMYRIKDR